MARFGGLNPKLLSLVGGLILFASWITQTTFYERWNDRLSSLERGETIYITTLSAVFVMQSDQHVGDWTTLLFRTGIDYIIRGLPQADQSAWSKRLSGTSDRDLNQMATQLMKHVEERHDSLEEWKALFLWLFVFMYFLGSLFIVLGEYRELRPSRVVHKS